MKRNFFFVVTKIHIAKATTPIRPPRDDVPMTATT